MSSLSPCALDQEACTRSENCSIKDVKGELCTSSLLEVIRAPFPTSFDCVSKRYFTHYIVRDCKKVKNNNCRLLQHSNSLIVLTLDPSHAAVVAGPEELDHIEFGSSRRPKENSSGNQQSFQSRSFSPIQVVGKRKKNAVVCHQEMRLCTIYMKNGDFFHIPACVNGFVLEYNELLIEHPEALLQCPLSEGFLAIISVNTSNNFAEMEKIWTATGGEALMDGEED